ncbi:MAG: hypothetical protein K1X89_02565 [Myxococcaceae bacterium]|nr:hypothetical protein [Myxococcaceae bacterium]
MTRNLAIGALLGFGFAVLALALWGGRTPPPPAAPQSPVVLEPDPFPRRKLGVPLDRVGRLRALPEPGPTLGPSADAGP